MGWGLVKVWGEDMRKQQHPALDRGIRIGVSEMAPLWMINWS